MKRIQVEITLGIIVTLLTTLIIVVYAMGENDRLKSNEAAAQAREIEVGAALFSTYCSRCHGTQGLGIPGLCPPLNDRNFFDNRLKEVGWSGGLEDYIIATASGGRLASTRPQIYPGQGTPAMPSFSEQYGGPLRVDQIATIAKFIENWEPTAQMVEAPTIPEGPVAGTDITKQLPEGDPVAGEALTNTLACTACHIAAPTGPAWMASADAPGIGTRAGERFQEADYTGAATSAEQYLFESIANPNVFVVSGFPANVMPQNYADTMTEQNMADIIAYLLTLK